MTDDQSQALTERPTDSIRETGVECIEGQTCCRYFQDDGGRFIAVGAHWIPADSALEWPLRWNPDSLRVDFEKMRDIGFSVVRMDVFWAWIEPYPGVYDEVALTQLYCLFDLGRQYGIYVHPCLFIGGETGYSDVPWGHGGDPQTDPELLRLQTDHAGMLAIRYRDELVLFAWDLSDGPPFCITQGTVRTDCMAINSTRLVSGPIRREDSEHLICVGTDAQELNHGPFRRDVIAEEVDVFSSHPYPTFNPALFSDSPLSERVTLGGISRDAFGKSRTSSDDSRALRVIGPVPVYTTEYCSL